ncbi:MAG: response regulator [Campylobacterota bacterium]|nr:response regulator [Campylobacterota bacterium]
MIDKEFLKTLTILVAEDDTEITDDIKLLLEKEFKKVIIAEDGAKALDIYVKSLKNKDEHIDMIVSDINMPHMNGIELLDNIRKIDNNIPFVIATAYADNENLLKVIEHGASSLLVKPLNIQTLSDVLKKLSIPIYEHKLAIHNKKEAEEYLGILNKVAIVSKTNDKGVIAYINDIFCDTSGYTKEELIGKNHNIVRHPDMLPSTFKSLWETIQSGKEWSGKVKNKTKTGEAYYVNATIFPLFDDSDTNIKGYMGIRFLTTEDEEKNRKFKTQVRELVTKHKQEVTKLRRSSDATNNIRCRESDMQILEERINKEKNKSSKLVGQINHYESEIKKYDRRHTDTITKSKEQINKYRSAVQHYMDKDKDIESKQKLFKKEIKTLLAEVDDKTKECARQEKEINRLKDVISHQDEKLK